MARQPKSKKIYRERSSVALFFKVLGMIVLALAVIFLVIFFWFQRYIVYTDNGVELQIPFLSFLNEDGEDIATMSPPPPPPPPSPTASAIIEETDTAGDDLSAQNTPQVTPAKDNMLTGIEVSGLSEAEAETVLSKLDEANADAIFVEMKNASGELMYRSTSETVTDYDIAIGPDVSKTVADLKENDVYLIAYISCFADDTLAERCVSAALIDENGEVYTDKRQIRWLDPLSEKTLDYISDICGELSDMGFDEVVLTDFSAPTVSDDLEKASILTNFASELKSEMGKTKLSVFCGSEIWSGEHEEIINEFSNVFYRLYADSANQETALTSAKSVFGEGFSERLVLMTDGEGYEDCGWIINK